MVVRDAHIKSYDWEVRIYYAVTCYHSNNILDDLISIECPEDLLIRIRKNLLKADMNTGFTYSNKKIKSTIMVIGLFSSPKQFLNSFEHELRHLIDDISITYNIDCNGEEVAYLTGYLNEILFKDIKLFLCDCKCNSYKNEKKRYINTRK